MRTGPLDYGKKESKRMRRSTPTLLGSASNMNRRLHGCPEADARPRTRMARRDDWRSAQYLFRLHSMMERRPADCHHTPDVARFRFRRSANSSCNVLNSSLKVEMVFCVKSFISCDRGREGEQK